MKESTKNVIKYLRSVNGTNVTSLDVANALNTTKKSVDGIFTMGIVKNKLGIRVPAQRLNDDGNYVNVNYLVLTDDGMNIDLDAN